MKCKVASTENAIEYAFRGFVSPAPEERCLDKFILDVNPNAGLSKARTFEPVASAKGFITRFHEKTEAPNPCNRIIGKPSFLI
ncbi:serine/threonine protein kinase [Sesbania bispinosa]|nr:serine/threonine protein kinase [Sesbania bispinosa]